MAQQAGIRRTQYGRYWVLPLGSAMNVNITPFTQGDPTNLPIPTIAIGETHISVQEAARAYSTITTRPWNGVRSICHLFFKDELAA